MGPPDPLDRVIVPWQLEVATPVRTAAGCIEFKKPRTFSGLRTFTSGILRLFPTNPIHPGAQGTESTRPVDPPRPSKAAWLRDLS